MIVQMQMTSECANTKIKYIYIYIIYIYIYIYIIQPEVGHCTYVHMLLAGHCLIANWEKLENRKTGPKTDFVGPCEIEGVLTGQT